MDEHREKEPRIDFPPLVNGVDYLLSAIENFDGNPTERNLKYAILHLQAGVEVLLKSRLIVDDWKLVFSKIEKADPDSYNRGDFKSCTVADAVARLSEIGINIPDDTREAISYLSRQRNRLQHLGLTDTSAAIEARAAEVLNFMLDFIREHLQPVVNDAEAGYLASQMDVVRARLHRIQSLVTTRMRALAPELSRAPWQTLHCPHCGQWSLVVDTEGAMCLFCRTEQDRQELPLDYVAVVLDQGYRAFRKGEPYANVCPECGENSLVNDVRVAAAPDTPQYFCFACAEAFSDVDECVRCGLPFRRFTEEETLCRNCWDDIIARQ
ncbi:hypothetical protein FLW53_26915 [Microbispora sp. SCL1-1]|uniref:hypothetical protein n=1 Tax=unclassified Microbispora TaxID=2614687 RepID=UPI00115A31E3|nr:MULTISPECIES: hypothetical protein [unclassified Microbispora]NJP27775.1 hypothetical protein [Microbispora sp. CL1-1]TQS10548.1 hypothetical protein FLW53_26915 [Microbispora sp. SCL1-1]